MANELLDNLNPSQLQAVTHDAGPLLIVAGAGTGKTTVLINRLAYLILEKKINPDDILILTFTDKATSEMEERADKILPYGYFDLWINTFHGFCERLLRQHGLDIGLNPDFKLLNTTEQWVLIKRHLDDLELDYYRPLGNPNKFIHEIIKHFSRLKDENISPSDYVKYAETLEGKGAAIPKKSNSDGELEVEDGDEELEAERIKELARAYEIYNQLLLDNNFLDFGDLIFYTLRLLQERPNILKIYSEKFKYMMVDEFQDTNMAQYELLKLLAGEKLNLVVVGDDDQCLPGDSLIITKTGKQRIDRIKVGTEVATAVGRGYLSYGRVDFVNKTKKNCRLITFSTSGGRKIKVTDNHKMFSYLPGQTDKKFYYVYLMNKQSLGWRIGITNNIKTRLRLERSADRILAVRSFASEAEARYHETLWALKYGIPTVCFCERDGIIDKKKWSERLYQELDVARGVIKMARDLDLDLEDHQFALGAVNRGGKVRIKINLEMCHRNYRSKGVSKLFLQSPAVTHLLSVETSHQPTINKLRKMGFNLTKAKAGYRLRLSDSDLTRLGKIAKNIQAASGGIIDNQIKVGKTNKTHEKASVIPAKNILPGMFLPVVVGNGIIYDQIIKRTEEKKEVVVYDLEVSWTHNFVANDVVVHNSIYKFRGASISNILQFKDDYPEAQEIILTENYRSQQEILDKAYHFVQNNNPNRLEAKLNINKKLVAKRPAESSLSPRVKFLNFNNDHEAAAFVVDKIKSEYQSQTGVSWQDFAILVRANDTADKYIKELKRQGLPYQFVSLKGLYFKPIILDIISYFKLLDNYHESAALFRVLNMDVFKVAYEDLVNINKVARTKVWSLYEALKNISSINNVSAESVANINSLLGFVEAHSELAKNSKPSRLFVKFVYDIGLFKTLDHDEDREIFSYLNQFYQKIKEFETADPDLRLKDFIEIINLEMEAGETGSLRLDYDDADVVKIMTIHAAKGLEFKYVFVVDLVDKRFPTINRGERISIPAAMIKEKLGEGSDFHLEEERRLFYVAMTRAKNELYLTAAKDYGGAKPKKPSRFITEMGIDPETGQIDLPTETDLFRDIKRLDDNVNEAEQKVLAVQLPEKFSFSQLAAYASCPLQYKLAFILRIPAPTDKPSLIFGHLMHEVLREFMLPLLVGEEKQLVSTQDDLSEARIMALYDKYWNGDGYGDLQNQVKYQQNGRVILQRFVHNLATDSLPQILFLEKDFVFKIGGESIKGAIDRVDKLADGTLEILDYKTGNPKEKLEWKDKRQLILYQLFLEDFLPVKVSTLSYYYLENGEKVSFVPKPKEIEKLQSEIIAEIKAIKSLNFTPDPDSIKCQFCDFKGICEFKK
ncbi:hypothetical protein COT98_02515 [Candidatus Falkowbacteria bacterium CG10_big_fil_rev_8_21_14_0_10_39_9]|uniref:DNA 3'-5' helicase n=1 Tax=Candidatus Falkowbacteria bacterium CG10_big_fil_rev_8_21_14_0_10_39_9 TaxID=1974566 RepID=A0A2M6WPL0_9BACT|nr:MAG: hypothetical protein COT98_02515 [Candidatus Falkowbacteria bacterium CG10_big_fil_rev_8_21_14_0_10_39_9]